MSREVPEARFARETAIYEHVEAVNPEQSRVPWEQRQTLECIRFVSCSLNKKTLYLVLRGRRRVWDERTGCCRLHLRVGATAGWTGARGTATSTSGTRISKTRSGSPRKRSTGPGRKNMTQLVRRKKRATQYTREGVKVLFALVCKPSPLR